MNLLYNNRNTIITETFPRKDSQGCLDSQSTNHKSFQKTTVIRSNKVKHNKFSGS